MADTSLIFSIIAKDRTSAVLEKIKRQASSTGTVAARALGPAIAPVAAVSTAAIMGTGAALASAGVAAGVFGAVAKSAMTEVSESATKVEDLRDKMELYGRQAQIMAARGEDNAKMLKKQAAAALELEARLSLLPPETRAATVAFLDMKSGWETFVETNKPATFTTISNGYRLIGTVVSKLQPFFDIGKRAADRLLLSLTQAANGGGLERMAERAGPAMDSLVSIITNVGTAVTRMFGKFGGEGQSVLTWIENMTARWARWATASESGTGINRFVDYVRANGPAVLSLLTSLAQAAINIAQAVAPLAPISLAVATALAGIIAAVPPGVLTAIVSGWLAFNLAMKAYALGSAIATAAQWAMNSALLASPITWIVLAIVGLVAVIYLVATRTRFFQTIWNATWGFMKRVGAWFAGPFSRFFIRAWNDIVASFRAARATMVNLINIVRRAVTSWANTHLTAARSIINAGGRVVSFFRSAPGRIRGALSGMFTPLWQGFRNAVNRIISGWNSLNFSIPGFSFAGMSFGGVSVGTPDLPYLNRGGHVQREGLAYIHRGETVTPTAKVTPYRGGGDSKVLVIKGDGSRTSNFLLELLREAIRDKGGDSVKVLSSG